MLRNAHLTAPTLSEIWDGDYPRPMIFGEIQKYLRHWKVMCRLGQRTDFGYVRKALHNIN